MSPSPDPASAGPIEYLFPASPGMLREIRAFITRLCEAAGVTGAELQHIVLVADEVATNAIEHSGSDGVRVRWEDSGHGIWITVADDGAFKVSSGKLGERGLGLKMVIGLADEVTVRAGRQSQRGTTVRLHMPVRSRATAPSAPGRPRLLLVDGDRFSGRSLSSFLASEGYLVEVVRSVPAARAALDAPFRLAIVDLLAPDGSALELCDQIGRSGIPLLTMSVLPPPADLEPVRFVRRPAHPLEVLTVVRQLVESPAAAGRNVSHA